MGCCASKPETKKEQQHTKGDEKSGEKDRERMLKLGGILEQPTGDVRDYYKFGAVIGKGNFGIVHKVTNRKTGETFACKSISKRKMVCKDDVEDVKREVQVLMHLSGHPNIVKMYSAFEDNQYIHFVMECCEGGELFDRIAARGKFTERMAAEAMRSIVSVVNHCHHMNVVHRDLKVGCGHGACRTCICICARTRAWMHACMHARKGTCLEASFVGYIRDAPRKVPPGVCVCVCV
eukprot:364228-Chlamydomonas_euryale.AAC.17